MSKSKKKKSSSWKLPFAITILFILVVGAFLMLPKADESTTDQQPIEPEVNLTPEIPVAEPEGLCDYNFVNSITQQLTEYNPHWEKLKEFNMNYYYAFGEISSYQINGVRKDLDTSDHVAILETLVCGEQALEVYNSTIDWSKEEIAWAKVEAGETISIEKRFLDNDTVNTVYLEIQSDTGFVTKLVEFTYSGNFTSLDDVDTSKTIAEWLQDYEGKVTYFKLNEFEYDFK